MKKTNIVLIGMPSSGKSTVGKFIADTRGMCFIDTDQLILEKAGKPLRDIVNDDGLERFLMIQEEVITGLEVERCVIATGGSAIYGSASMNRLKECGVVVFLRLDLADLEKRIASGRRFARNEGQSLDDLYNERMPLYEKYADITVDCTGKQVDEIAQSIIKLAGIL